MKRLMVTAIVFLASVFSFNASLKAKAKLYIIKQKIVQSGTEQRQPTGNSVSNQ